MLFFSLGQGAARILSLRGLPRRHTVKTDGPVPPGYVLAARRTGRGAEDYIRHVLAFDVLRGTATRVEKLVTFFTSRGPAVSDTLV